GSNPPSGSVTQRQYAPAALDDMNESPTGQNSYNTSAPVSIETSTLSSPSSITLPPYSVTALDYTAASEPISATPTFTPSTGRYATPQAVTITSTAGAAIYYTTDGSAPTTSSSLYSGPIAVGANETLKAIAIAPGFESSPLATAAYNISTALPALDVTPAATAASTIAPVLPAPASSLAAVTNSTTQSLTTMATSAPVINCPSGFASSGACGV